MTTEGHLLVTSPCVASLSLEWSNKQKANNAQNVLSLGFYMMIMMLNLFEALLSKIVIAAKGGEIFL